MSADQFRRYRQIGTYGAYRVALRKVRGLTTGDGWTPDVTALKLADLVNDSLPPAARLQQKHFETGTKWGRWDGGGETRYWVGSGWRGALENLGGLLPTAGDAVRKRLPEEERRILKSALFDNDPVRSATADVLASAKDAHSHAALCDALARSTTLAKKIVGNASLVPLPAFTRLADAGMDAMRKLWDEIRPYYKNEKDAPTTEELSEKRELRNKLGKLRKQSKAWLDAPGRDTFRHDHIATQLAQTMYDAGKPIDQLRALAKHHEEHGGGRRWFREQAGQIVPLVEDTGIAANDYRFRLRSICLLAAQCGIPSMKHPLDVLDQDRFGEKDAATQQQVDDDGGPP